LLSWLEGEDLQKTVITDEIAYIIGQTIGKLHNAMSIISCQDRYYYNEVFVDKVSDDIRKAYELKHITEWNYRMMQDALSYIRRVLIEARQQFILVHADLSKSNLIYSNGEICPIDFSLSGYALAEMDLSDMNWTLHDEKLTPSLFAGYQSVTKHEINQSFISMFTALYPISYTASHHNIKFQDEKFVQALERWCDTILTPFISSQLC
jgi:Ser/Thr protein kinase RdoA (MazF antagonist)